MEAPPINGNHVIEESEVEKPSEVVETLALDEKPNGPTNEIPIETNGIPEDHMDVSVTSVVKLELAECTFLPISS